MAFSLGIDASTQSVSAVVIDLDTGTFVYESSINFGQQLPQYKSPNGFLNGTVEGEVYSNPLMWLDALELLLADLKAHCDLKQIKTISGAGQQHGSVYLNADWAEAIGTLSPSQTLSEQIKPCLSRINAPIWMDTSTGIECEEIASAIGGNEKVCTLSGSICVERFTGPQIRRFFKSSPDAYAQTSRIHLVSSFICSILSGTDAPIDTGDGAGMNLMNIQSFDWDAELLEATAPDLKSKLPGLVPGNTSSGSLAPYFSEKYGFDSEVSISVFTGDNPSSLVGAGASAPGKVVISLGTSDTYFAAMPNVVSDPNGYGHVFGNPSGGSMSLQCFLNGSLAREAVKDHFNYDWDQFTEALTSTAAGNNGNYMLPFFGQEISPRYHGAQPILVGSDAFKKGELPKASIRACVEGQFINMRVQTDWMEMRPTTLYITGGASSNDAIAQILADIFQAKVQRLFVSGSVALGGAIRAAQHNLDYNLSELEATFCKKNPACIEPNQESAPAYSKAIATISKILSEL